MMHLSFRNKFPVMVCGVSSTTGKFFASFTVLASDEDAQTWREIYKFIHGLNVHPLFRMGDGAPAITRGGTEEFADCDDDNCKNSRRLMCWSHVIRLVLQ